MSMMRDELVKRLNERRNNEVVVKISDTKVVMNITSIRYSPRADRILLFVEKPYELEVVEDLILVLREMDSLAKEYGIDVLPQYDEIKKSAAESIGCTVDYISSKE
jgi:hypothetical protein